MSSPASKKILIVEDERDILQLVKLYLEKEGFRTLSASTGTEGLRQVKQEKPDLVVLDLMLPEIDGLEICKRLRSAPETAMLPIIMLTAKAEESDTIMDVYEPFLLQCGFLQRTPRGRTATPAAICMNVFRPSSTTRTGRVFASPPFTW